MYGWMKDSYRVMVGKTERERQLGRPRYRWECNSKIYLQQIGCQGVEWTDLA
jgi:hypothetical protein